LSNKLLDDLPARLGCHEREHGRDIGPASPCQLSTTLATQTLRLLSMDVGFQVLVMGYEFSAD
jgi:hypothetical protein